MEHRKFLISYNVVYASGLLVSVSTGLCAQTLLLCLQCYMYCNVMYCNVNVMFYIVMLYMFCNVICNNLYVSYRCMYGNVFSAICFVCSPQARNAVLCIVSISMELSALYRLHERGIVM